MKNKKYLIPISLLVCIIIGYIIIFITIIAPPGIIAKVGKTKISNKSFEILKKIEPEKDEQQLLLDLIDTVILYKAAVEKNITYKKSDLENYDSYGELAKYFFVKDIYVEELSDFEVNNKEIRSYYDNIKNTYYIKDSNFQAFAIQSNKKIKNIDMIPNKDKKNTFTTNYQILKKHGIFDPQIGLNVIEENDETKTFKYIVITKGEIDYIPFDSVKNKLKKDLYNKLLNEKIQNIILKGYEEYSINIYKKKTP
ncbi:MAG: hypothetical protein ACOCRX_01950 [Candidatus Woesearchaeota archaeon]